MGEENGELRPWYLNSGTGTELSLQNSADDLPMFAVYETVDLGVVSMLNEVDPSLLDIIQGNYPVFVADPIHGDSLYLYHAFGVQALNFRALLEGLAVALQDENDDKGGALQAELKKEQGVEVTPVLSTFSVERRWAASFLESTAHLTTSQILEFGGIARNPERCLFILQHFHVDLRHARRCAPAYSPNRRPIHPKIQICPGHPTENACSQLKGTTTIYTHTFIYHRRQQTEGMDILFRI